MRRSHHHLALLRQIGVEKVVAVLVVVVVVGFLVWRIRSLEFNRWLGDYGGVNCAVLVQIRIRRVGYGGTGRQAWRVIFVLKMLSE